MSDFTKEQERIITAAVRNYREMDRLRDDEKQRIEDFMLLLSKRLKDDFPAFRKNPKATIKALVLKWVKDNKDVFDKSAKLGKNYAEDIL